MFETVLDDKLVGGWVIDRLPMPQRKGFEATPDYPLRGIGYKVNDKLVMGIIFYNHIPWHKSVEVGIALEPKQGAFLRGMLRHAMVYPFVQLGCQRVTAMAPKRAKASRNFMEILGFEEEGNIRHGFGTDDCIVYGLLKKQAEEKWNFSSLQAT